MARKIRDTFNAIPCFPVSCVLTLKAIIPLRMSQQESMLIFMRWTEVFISAMLVLVPRPPKVYAVFMRAIYDRQPRVSGEVLHGGEVDAEIKDF